MNEKIQEEINELKKKLVFLRMYKITKQQNETHKIKKIQHKISQIYQFNSKTLINE